MWGSISALGFGIMLFSAVSGVAQDNYEIQIYDSETVEPHHTMLEPRPATLDRGIAAGKP